MNKYFQIAAKIAGMSKCNHRLGAVLVRGGSVLGVGVNKLKTDPLIDRLSKRWIGHPVRGLHAEMDCVSELSLEQTKNTTLYVVRVLKRGLGLAKPCRMCQAYLTGCGVKRVKYSVDSDKFETMIL